MLRHTPFRNLPTYKLILGFSLCSLGGALLYTYFKTRDDDDDVVDGGGGKGKVAAKSQQQQKTPRKQKEICMKLVIANDHVPLVVGRNGANLRLIEQKTNTKIRLRDKDNEHKFCDISGYPAGVRDAHDMVFKEINRAPVVKEEMQVPLNVGLKLNGRGGEILYEIGRNSVAKIYMDLNSRQGKAKITIIGNQKQVNMAIKMIEDKIEANELLQLVIAEVEQKREPRRSPTNSMNSSMYSSQNSLTSHLAPRDKLLAARTDEKPMEVYVSAVASPSKFWVQLVGPQSKKLDEMVEQMTTYYNVPENRANHVLGTPYVGQIVAAIFKYDDKWYRAEIVEIVPDPVNPNGIMVDLYFVDYGDSEYVMPADIYELRTDFLTLRFQAVECFLANIKPNIVSEPGIWDVPSTKKFEELTEVANWKKLIARVVNYRERSKPEPGVALNSTAREGAPVPGIELFDPTEGIEINLGHMLITHGYALPSENSLPRSRSYTPTSTNGSDSTIEEINRSMTPTTSMTTKTNDNNNTNGESDKIIDGVIDAENSHFAKQLEHLNNKTSPMYLQNDNVKVAAEAIAANPAKLSEEFHNGNANANGNASPSPATTR